MKTLTQILKSKNVSNETVTEIIDEFRQLLPNFSNYQNSRISDMGIRIKNEIIMEVLNLL